MGNMEPTGSGSIRQSSGRNPLMPNGQGEQAMWKKKNRPTTLANITQAVNEGNAHSRSPSPTSVMLGRPNLNNLQNGVGSVGAGAQNSQRTNDLVIDDMHGRKFIDH